MKHVYILPGTGSKSDDYWFPYIKNQLDTKEFTVYIPELPHPDEPVLDECLDALKDFHFDENSILIGHSSGCPLILSILERSAIPVGRVICVAGFSHPLGGNTYPILQPTYDWHRIRTKCKEFYFIHSLDDPWGCGKDEGETFQKHLGGTLILFEREGHMGSTTFHQEYREFPLVQALIELPLTI